MDIILKNKRAICLAGCVLMMIGVFFTFVKVEVSMFGFSQSESTKYIEGDGWVVLIAAIVAIVLICRQKERYSLIGTGIALLTTLYDMANVGDASSAVGGLAKIKFGMSPWLILIGIILAAAPVIMDWIVSNRGRMGKAGQFPSVLPSRENTENKLGNASGWHCDQCGADGLSSSDTACPYCGTSASDSVRKHSSPQSPSQGIE